MLAVQFLHKITDEARSTILLGAALFTHILDQALFLVEVKMPQKIWFNVLVGPAIRMDRWGQNGTVRQGLRGHDTVASLGGEKWRALSCCDVTTMWPSMLRTHLATPHPPSNQHGETRPKRP